MASKTNIVYKLLKNQSLSASFTSPATVVRTYDNFSYQINVTTTDSEGTFQVQVSNDYYVNEANGNVIENPGNWIPLTLAGGTPSVVAADTNIAIDLNQLGFYAVRIAYISTVAGTGTANVYVTGKRIG